MKRRLFNLLVILCLALFVAVCVLWVRSRSGFDRARWMWCRYQPDRSIVSDEAELTSNQLGVELFIMHGHAPPRNPNLVRGYDINADNTGGRPQFSFNRQPNGSIEDWGWVRTQPAFFRWPIRVSTFSKHDKEVADSWSITITFSHWMLLLLLIVPPALWLRRFRKERRVRTLGLCRNCGYDLRASKERCPECGAAIATSHP